MSVIERRWPKAVMRSVNSYGEIRPKSLHSVQNGIVVEATTFSTTFPLPAPCPVTRPGDILTSASKRGCNRSREIRDAKIAEAKA